MRKLIFFLTFAYAQHALSSDIHYKGQALNSNQTCEFKGKNKIYDNSLDYTSYNPDLVKVNIGSTQGFKLVRAGAAPVDMFASEFGRSESDRSYDDVYINSVGHYLILRYRLARDTGGGPFKYYSSYDYCKSRTERLYICSNLVHVSR